MLMMGWQWLLCLTHSPKDVKELVVFTADRIQPFLDSLSTYSSAATVRLLALTLSVMR